MDIKRVCGIYFSATGTTEKIVQVMASGLADKLMPGEMAEFTDFTLPDVRNCDVTYGDGDLVVIGTPTYAGRVPNVLLPYLKNRIHAEGAIAVPVVLYGNRSFDDSLLELAELMRDNGAKIIAACAFIGEHSFSYKLAAGRPDEHDIKCAEDFVRKIFDKVSTCEHDVPELLYPVQKGTPIRPYYTPRDRNGNSIDIRKVLPVTGPECDKCGICASVCPMRSIDKDDPAVLTGICIKCGACVKKCPKKCKYFDDKNYLYHMHELEDMYTDTRKEPELFI